MKTNLRILKAKIKGLAAEGASVRKDIHLSKGNTKDYYWGIKRDVGTEARLHLLAYGFLRGKTYREMEPKSNISFFLIYYLKYKTENFRRLLSIIHAHADFMGKKKWTEEYLLNEINPQTEKKEAA